MTINTCFFGINITLRQRDLLDAEAQRRNITRNALIRALIEEMDRNKNVATGV
jgi:hypothetical protein